MGIGPFTFAFADGVAMPPLAERQYLPPAQLEVFGGEVQHSGQRITLIGKRSDSDVLIHDEEVSTAHAAMFDMDGRRYVRNLGSRLGTYVNGKAVSGIEIRLGDEIRVGSAVLRCLPVSANEPGMMAGGERIGEVGGRVVEPDAHPGNGHGEDHDAPSNGSNGLNGHGSNGSNGHASNGNGANGHAIEQLGEHSVDEEPEAFR